MVKNKELSEKEIIQMIKREWESYKQTLIKKYPSVKGKWEFTCDHHKKINEILNSVEMEECIE